MNKIWFTILIFSTLSRFGHSTLNISSPIGPNAVRIIVELDSYFRIGDAAIYFGEEDLAYFSIHGAPTNRFGFLSEDERFHECKNFEQQKALFSVHVNGQTRPIKDVQCIWPLENP